MDGRAKRGESLAGKTIALAAVLVTLLAAGTLLSACAQQRTTSQFAVAQPAIPQKASENNPEAWLDALEQNPIDQSFVDSLAAFAYRSTASVLGDGADDAKANRMYSPLSLYYALALANEGAAGQTRDEIASVLGAPSTVDVPQQCGNLFRVLTTDPFSTVDLANSIWMAKDAPSSNRSSTRRSVSSTPRRFRWSSALTLPTRPWPHGFPRIRAAPSTPR